MLQSRGVDPNPHRSAVLLDEADSRGFSVVNRHCYQ